MHRIANVLQCEGLKRKLVVALGAFAIPKQPLDGQQAS